MTVFTRTWDGTYLTVPTNTEAANLGAQRIRFLKVDVGERLVVDHSWAGDADDGEHKKVTFAAPLGADPTNVANKGFIYLKDVSSVVELHWIDESGNVLQLTTGGALKIANNLIDADALANDAVDTNAILDDAVTLGKQADGTQGGTLYYGASGVLAELAVGTDGYFLKTQGAAANPAWASSREEFAQFTEEQADNTVSGDSLVAGSWTKRTLNTTRTNTVTSATLTASVVNLPAGTYYIEANAPAQSINVHQIRLRNTSDGATALVGETNYASATNTVMNQATLSGRVTIASSKNFELQHWIQSGSGGAPNDSTGEEVEVYSNIRIWRLNA